MDREATLRSLSDRQLLRRWERYHRSSVMMDVWVEQSGGLLNAVGARANVLRWKEAAEKELKRRELDLSDYDEVWSTMPPSERVIHGLQREVQDDEMAYFSDFESPRKWADPIIDRLENKIGWRLRRSEIIQVLEG